MNKKLLFCFVTLSFVGCRTTAATERQHIAERQQLLKECEFISFNDKATRVESMWMCRSYNKFTRFLSSYEQAVLKLRDYRKTKEDVAYGQQSASKPEGQMAPEEIEWVIRKNTSNLSNCQPKNTTVKNDTQFKIYLNIESNGKVQTAKVLESNLNSETFSRCVAKELKGWSFPTLRAGLKNLELNYPIVLNR